MFIFNSIIKSLIISIIRFLFYLYRNSFMLWNMFLNYINIKSLLIALIISIFHILIFYQKPHKYFYIIFIHKNIINNFHRLKYCNKLIIQKDSPKIKDIFLVFQFLLLQILFSLFNILLLFQNDKVFHLQNISLIILMYINNYHLNFYHIIIIFRNYYMFLFLNYLFLNYLNRIYLYLIYFFVCFRHQIFL
jgi:hypothetical protein